MRTEDNHQLRNTFDQDAVLYDKARPGYPEPLFDDIISLSNIPTDGRILEIGCGTGQATVPFAQRGYTIDCIELGANLAEIAQHNLASYPKVMISTGNFETWPVQTQHYDLVFSATAFHWIDPAIGYQKVHKSLKPGGTIALFWYKHVITEVSADFFQRVQKLYEDITPEIVDKAPPRPEELPTPVKQEIERTNLFGEVVVRIYPMNISFDADSFTNLLNTFSGHRVLEEPKRIRLLQEISHLIDSEFGGLIIKEYGVILYLAQAL